MPFEPKQYIDQAYEWLCHRRKHYHFNNDVWHLRIHWQRTRARLIRLMKTGAYAFDWVRVVRTPERRSVQWQAQDVLVLKTISLWMEEQLRPVLGDCIYHLAGKDDTKKGAKAAIREVYQAVPRYRFVLRTDVKGYYASIQHDLLLAQLAQYIDEPAVLRMCRQFLRHTVQDGGRLYDLQQGISLGCPLSPLLGALFLKPLDDAMQQLEVFYIRFMDDWVVMAPTRWKLRRAIAKMNQCLEALQLDKHPDKTSMGPASRGFDFLGYHFRPLEEAPPPGLSQKHKGPPTGPKMDAGAQPPPRKIPQVQLVPAQKTVNNYLQKCARLYEQGAAADRIGRYREHWRRWCQAGLQGYVMPKGTSEDACAMWAGLDYRGM